MTAARARALRFIGGGDLVNPSSMAAHLWPDSEHWGRRGGAARLHRSAGAYLGKLRAAGLVRETRVFRDRRFQPTWELTTAGHEALAEL